MSSQSTKSISVPVPTTDTCVEVRLFDLLCAPTGAKRHIWGRTVSGADVVFDADHVDDLRIAADDLARIADRLIMEAGDAIATADPHMTNSASGGLCMLDAASVINSLHAALRAEIADRLHNMRKTLDAREAMIGIVPERKGKTS